MSTLPIECNQTPTERLFGYSKIEEKGMTDTMLQDYRIAVVQHPPVLLDKAATLERAVSLLHEAADNGAKLVAFSETFVPGYPEWIGLVRYRTESSLIDNLHARLMANAVNLQSNDLDLLCRAAEQRNVTVICGIQEKDGLYSRSTLYNSVVVIGANGTLLNCHRKLVPTGVERGLWGYGDGAGLQVVETPVGRIGALICYENHMPLARFSLYAQGIDLYIAPTVAFGDLWLSAMRHIAFEGACWVLNCGTALHRDAIPESFPERERLSNDEWVRNGDSAIINPMGKVVAGPLHCAYGILYADCSPGAVTAMRRRLDVAGHYGRPDLFHLEVNRGRQTPIHFTGTN